MIKCAKLMSINISKANIIKLINTDTIKTGNLQFY